MSPVFKTSLSNMARLYEIFFSENKNLPNYHLNSSHPTPRALEDFDPKLQELSHDHLSPMILLRCRQLPLKATSLHIPRGIAHDRQGQRCSVVCVAIRPCVVLLQLARTVPCPSEYCSHSWYRGQTGN